MRPTEEQKCVSHYHDLEGGFHHSVTVGMPTGSMVHETASFYWHGIQSVPLGYMSLLCGGGRPLRRSCTCQYLYHPIPLEPLLLRLHLCKNTISLVKMGRTTFSRPILFLIDYADQPFLCPPIPPPQSLNSSGVGLMPTAPPTSFLLPPSDLAVCPPTYTSPLSTSCRVIVAAGQRKWGQGGKKNNFSLYLLENRLMCLFSQM